MGGVALIVLAAVLLLGLAPLLARPRLVRELPVLVLGGPLLLGLVTLIAIVLTEDWSGALYPRYLSPMIAPFALCGVWVWRELVPDATLRWTVRIATASGIALALVWIYMTGAHYFIHLGSHFGIHAAAG